MTSNKQTALDLIHEGQALVVEGKTSEALEKFKASVELYPTPEGYTYWAWMLSYESKLEECILLCEQAIVLDPEFGNAYNDIGSYLIELERPEEAIPWLIKAKDAQNYDARHFPYLNLARVYLKLGRDDEAREEYIELLKLDPNNVEGQFLSEFLADAQDKGRFSKLFSIN